MENVSSPSPSIPVRVANDEASPSAARDSYAPSYSVERRDTSPEEIEGNMEVLRKAQESTKAESRVLKSLVSNLGKSGARLLGGVVAGLAMTTTFFYSALANSAIKFADHHHLIPDGVLRELSEKAADFGKVAGENMMAQGVLPLLNFSQKGEADLEDLSKKYQKYIDISKAIGDHVGALGAYSHALLGAALTDRLGSVNSADFFESKRITNREMGRPYAEKITPRPKRSYKDLQLERLTGYTKPFKRGGLSETSTDEEIKRAYPNVKEEDYKDLRKAAKFSKFPDLVVHLKKHFDAYKGFRDDEKDDRDKDNLLYDIAMAVATYEETTYGSRGGYGGMEISAMSPSMVWPQVLKNLNLRA